MFGLERPEFGQTPGLVSVDRLHRLTASSVVDVYSGPTTGLAYIPEVDRLVAPCLANVALSRRNGGDEEPTNEISSAFPTPGG